MRADTASWLAAVQAAPRGADRSGTLFHFDDSPITHNNHVTGKGGKNRRRGKNENESEKRELVFKEDGQEYAQVIKMLGNGRLEAMCFDGTKRLCHIRGKLRKKDNKADVILKYNADEARSLKAYGELPEHAKINETDTFGPGDDDEIQFDDIGDDDEDIDDI
ncbi:Eukaryotic translation initiation factor 1A, X-chromosomal [Liparis tanakae]|uniref:Eukaryotic translation initiation factor 4C n=1 Tax=Liparis tanakae TaxID=230148 RepID=A0A4Z2EZH4_9TELE|nr:Eukaryotic translation initiation factor 1A, X-chromosomal [Liparis tanakae]